MTTAAAPQTAAGPAFNAWDYGHALARSGVAGKVGTGAYAVLHTIASHANKQGQAQVGHARIAQECGLSRRTVIGHIATLCACRALAVHQARDDQTGINAVNLYVILPLDGIQDAAPTQRRKEQAKARGRVRRQRGNTSETTDSSDDTDTTRVKRPTLPPGEATDTAVVTVAAPKAPPLSTQGISVPMKHACAAACPRRARGARARAETTPSIAYDQDNEGRAASTACAGGTVVRGVPDIHGAGKRRLADRDPHLAADRDAAVQAYLDLTGEEISGRLRREAESCVKAYGLDDTLATLHALWNEEDGFWRRGSLTFAAVKKRVPAFRQGALAPRPTRGRRPVSWAGGGPTAEQWAALTDEEVCSECQWSVGAGHDEHCTLGQAQSRGGTP